MPKFCSAEDLVRRYAVSSMRLLAFAERGNLSMRRRGSLLEFDERAVARLFPRRAADSGDASLLGHARLGAYSLGQR